ncbi:hypothetical protein GGR88_001244 [Sphingomonas jejuensis]|uniref:Beta/gamma crystallin 'Greek key' domain-containing protein n=1 Tax=Sphingomonas jejuensis TaxID=904715 RepID=A0ABX0XM49_9SPHN|nr:beta/gamma crystallin-related protein [Sphingomonas jejuensis]NJC33770.1 hypothetical protein [Sphingomonas jejuensis]
MRTIGLAVLALLLTGPAAAQDERFARPPGQAEAIIYRDLGYRGPAVNVSEPQRNLGLSWSVSSIRVQSGEWQLCDEVNFGGRCTTIDRSTPVLVPSRRLRSMRPLGEQGGGGGAVQPGRGTSLRGMAAEFFPAPQEGRYRVEACARSPANAGCAARTADTFCTARGWSGSAREAMETVGRRIYLADVLCTRTGR